MQQILISGKYDFSRRLRKAAGGEKDTPQNSTKKEFTDGNAVCKTVLDLFDLAINPNSKVTSQTNESEAA